MEYDDRVGTTGHWELPVGDHTIISDGTYLGWASSRSPRHYLDAHPNGIEKPPEGIDPRTERPYKCSACRWSEFRIFREDVDGKPADLRPYLIHISGFSVLPEETPRYRTEDMLTAQEVIEVLTTRRAQLTYLSRPAARALAQAAGFDRGALSEAYAVRRVA